jgi:hypothetical protein
MKTDKKQNRWRRLLRKAANLLERKGWHRGCLARNSTGAKVDIDSPAAESFCLVGAIYKANNESCKDPIRDLTSLARLKVSQSIYSKSITGWNDTIASSKEEVIAKLREVANGA